MFRVNLCTGELCLTFSDLWLPGLVAVNLQRAYQSQSTYRGAFGLGWSHPYDMALERDGSYFSLRRGPDELHRFASVSGEPSGPYTLSRVGESWCVEVRADRLAYYFDATGAVMRLRGIVDRNGNRLLCHQDAEGRLAALIDPVGRRVEIDWRGGLVRQIALCTDARPDERQLVLRCGYDDHGRLISTVNGAGAEVRYGWADSRMVWHINALGGMHCAGYDAEGRCIRIWENDGKYSHDFAYDTVRRTTLSTDSAGHATLHRFDEGGNLAETVDPLGQCWKKVRDATGAVLASLDPIGRPEVLSQFDPKTRTFSRTDAAGSKTTLEKDAQGNVVAVVDAAGQKWQYRHDERGNVTAMKTPAENVWRFTFSDRGERVGAVDPTGARRTWRWSTDRRELVVEDDLGLVESRSYDLLGRTVRFADGRGSTFRVVHEARRQRIINGDGSEQCWDFDAMGNIVAHTDEAGQVWRFEWDRYGRMQRSIDPMGAASEFACDAEGRIFAVTNERGQSLEHTRDALGRIVRELDFAGGERHWRYDSGQLPVHTRIQSGDAVSVERDPVGRPVKRRYAGDVVFEDAYDGLGRLVSSRGPSGGVEMAFEPEGRPLAERSVGGEVRWEYGPGHHPVGLSAPARDIRFGWDVRGRLKSLDEGSLRATCSYDDGARRDTIRFDTGVAIVREYDVRKRLVRQHVERSGAASIIDERWSYSSTGNPLARKRRGLAELAFEHNRRGELTSVRRGDADVRRFAYDPAGNMVEIDGRAQSCDAGNRLNQTSTATWHYDGNGQPTSRRTAKDVTHFAFDALGRLASVHDSTEGVSFDYDPFFRRTEKRTSAGSDRMLWAGNSPLNEQLADGSSLHYLFHPVDDVPLALSINGVWHYAVTGFRGELTDLVRATDGALVWSAEPHGFEMDVTRDELGVTMPLRERGQLADPETGLVYQRARYFDPQTCRFLSPDPLGVFAGLNFYRYCFNRPFVLMDPLGLACTATEAECDGWHADIKRRQTRMDKRWNESFAPKKILPWSGAPPLGDLVTVASAAADGTPIAVGETSMGSVDTHLKAYDDEQRGMGADIQNYYAKGCAKYEDAARAESMADASTWSTKPMSLPAYGLP